MKQNISKALYALSGGRVEARRSPVARPLVIAMAGMALLIVYYVLIEDRAGTLGILTLFTGLVALLVGAVMVVRRLTGSQRVPYDTQQRRYMRFEERYYERELIEPLKRAIARGDHEAINALPTTNVSAVTLVSYRSGGYDLVVYALYEYANFEQREIVEPKVIGL